MSKIKKLDEFLKNDKYDYVSKDGSPDSEKEFIPKDLSDHKFKDIDEIVGEVKIDQNSDINIEDRVINRIKNEESKEASKIEDNILILKEEVKSLTKNKIKNIEEVGLLSQRIKESKRELIEIENYFSETQDKILKAEDTLMITKDSVIELKEEVKSLTETKAIIIENIKDLDRETKESKRNIEEAKEYYSDINELKKDKAKLQEEIKDLRNKKPIVEGEETNQDFKFLEKTKEDIEKTIKNLEKQKEELEKDILQEQKILKAERAKVAKNKAITNKVSDNVTNTEGSNILQDNFNTIELKILSSLLIQVSEEYKFKDSLVSIEDMKNLVIKLSESVYFED